MISQAASDSALGHLAQWGIAGLILAVFVAPMFWLMARGVQRREDGRAQLDAEERKLRAARESKLIDALTMSVEQQRIALDEWRRFESAEEKTHEALLRGMTSVAENMGAMTQRMRDEERSVTESVRSQERIASLLESIATRLETRTTT